MRLFTPRTLMIVLSSFFMVSTSLASEHNHDKPYQTDSQLIDGKKWQIDSSLHEGMNRIKHSMQSKLSSIHEKTFEPAQYKALAAEIDMHLTYLFENCKLSKDADAQLHILLFKVIEGKEQMRASTEQRAGAVTIIKTLKLYPKYFDDKNWQPLQH